MIDNDSYEEHVIKHYESIWNAEANYYLFDKGPIQKMSSNFRILEFEPTTGRDMWTYATSGMSASNELNPIELHIFSFKRDASIIELLTAVAYYHKNTSRIGLNNFVNFGRPWQNQSICEFGFISLPYLDGPDLESMDFNGREIKFYWLIPVTLREKDFAIKNGIEALEEKFESGLDYLDPLRNSMV
jgi:hypothetical protein